MPEAAGGQGTGGRVTPRVQAIRVRDLTRKFGDFTAVDRVTFQVAEAEIFGFLGPNGAGKTTTIRMLIGILPLTAGDAWVSELNVRTEGEAVRRRIGYMSQRFSLYPDLTVDENIHLFAGLYGVTGDRFRERRDWVLGMAGLENHVGRATGGLPLGWKQRLALGCAVLHEPPILFLDEPTSGVDPSARREFWDLINDLAQGGTTILVSTHYMEEAEYCNRMVLMNRGRVVAVDTPSGLRDRMTDPIIEVGTPVPPKAVDALRGVMGVREAAMFGRKVHVVVEDDQSGPILIQEILNSKGVPISSLEQISPSLEDVFVGLIQEEGGAMEG